MASWIHDSAPSPALVAALQAEAAMPPGPVWKIFLGSEPVIFCIQCMDCTTELWPLQAGFRKLSLSIPTQYRDITRDLHQHGGFSASWPDWLIQYTQNNSPVFQLASYRFREQLVQPTVLLKLLQKDKPPRFAWQSRQKLQMHQRWSKNKVLTLFCLHPSIPPQ